MNPAYAFQDVIVMEEQPLPKPIIDEKKDDIEINLSAYISGPSSPGHEKDVQFANHGELKLAADGKTVLVPQPSDDTNDPLNWSWMKKHTVFLALLPGCLLTDFVITWGITLFVPQAMQWHMSPPAVANSISGAVFMQGPGGLLAVSLCQRYGRAPVLFWSQLLSLITTIGATCATDYAGFTAARTLQGACAAAPQVIGLSIIHDMFFLHERARKINIWACTFLIGPYLGPFISAFLVETLTWPNVFAVLCGFYAFSVLAVVVFFDETLYDRANPKTRAGGVGGRIKLLIGITGWRESAGRPSIWTVMYHQVAIVCKPYILLPTFGFTMFMTMWTIGIVSTISLLILPPPYLFSETNFALLFIAPMIGTLAAEAWGHWFNDFLLKGYLKKNPNIEDYQPEHRLRGVYPPWIMAIGGLILFGQAFQHTLSWVAVAFGWGMLCFGTLGTTTAVSAYILDVFPHHAALASAWILSARVLGGFCVVYFQTKWIEKDGPAGAFGAQAGIMAAAIAAIAATQYWGPKWRKQFPAPDPEN